MLSAVLGLFAFIVGLYAIRHVLVSVVALALLLGIFWVVNGFVEIFNALAHRDYPNRGWTGFMGVLSILAGIVVLAYPGISLVTLALVLGIWLIIYGVMEIAAAFSGSGQPWAGSGTGWRPPSDHAPAAAAGTPVPLRK